MLTTHSPAKEYTRPTRSVLVRDGSRDVNVTFFGRCLEPWNRARWICRQTSDSDLWQPRSEGEYEAVFRAIGYDDWTREPNWLFNPRRGFHWWIGFINRNNQRSRAYYASNRNRYVPWRSLTEVNRDESCVDIFAGKQFWGDHNCNEKLPFICARRTPRNELNNHDPYHNEGGK